LKSIDKSANVLYEKGNAGIKNFTNLTSYFCDIPNEILELLVQKGVFPYSYLDSFEKLESTEYPNYESFYDNPKDKKFSRKNMKEERNYGIILSARLLKNIWSCILLVMF
jgi:hypothetical protein